MSFNKGPEYDKRPEIKNYTRESTFKVPRNLLILGFIVAIIAFFLIFNPFSSIEKDLVDTKWEFTIEKKYQWKNNSPQTSSYFNYVAIEDLNIYSFSYASGQKKSPSYNGSKCLNCTWSTKGDSVFFFHKYYNSSGEYISEYIMKGKINKNLNVIKGKEYNDRSGYTYYNVEFIGRKIED